MKIPFGKRLTAVLSIGWLVGLGPACKESKPEEAEPKRPEAAGETQPAPAERTTAEPRPAAESEHRPFFYEVSKDGATSHLLGTMHLGFDYQELPDSVWKALAASDEVVLELDLRKLGVGFADKAILPPGETLKEKLGDETWADLRAQLGGFPAEQLDRLRPWAAANLLMARLFPTAVPLDMAVLREAEAGGRDLVFLETPEMQLELLADVMDAEAIAKLLDESSEMRKQLAAGIEAYQEGDYDALMESALDTSQYGGPEMIEKFLYRRNEAWMDALLPLLTDGGAFVAVGAGHLGGDRGLIALLEKQGFQVERLSE